MKTFHYLKEGFEEETRKCRNSSCSRNGRIHIVKMIVLPNTIDQYSAILIKIPTPFLTEIGKKKSENSYRTTKDPRDQRKP